MPEKNTLTVKINGQEYTIASKESREYMLSVADLVDRKMKELTKQNPELSTAMAAVLAALNMADEYTRLKRSEDELIKNIVEYTEQIKKMEEKIAVLERRNQR